MTNRCEWCGAKRDSLQPFDADWRRYHYAGCVEREAWHVCDERCEALLREHLKASIERGFRSMIGCILWSFAFCVLLAGVPLLVVGTVAARCGCRVQDTFRIGASSGLVAMGVGSFLWLRSAPIWGSLRKPSRARFQRMSFRTAERLCRVGSWVVLFVMFAGGVIGFLVPD